MFETSTRSPITGGIYQGGNQVLLITAAIERGYTDSRWMTFKQATAQGYRIKKDSKGTACQRLIKIQVEDKATGKEKTIPQINVFTLFNAAQIEGIPALEQTA